MSSRWRWWRGGLRLRRVLVLATALALVVAAGAAAQETPRLPVRVSARLGFVGASADYQSGCGYSSALYGVEVRTRDRAFGWVAADRYSDFGGTDQYCYPPGSAGDGRPGSTLSSWRGGLELEDATRLSAGVGGRLPLGAVQIEGTLGAGATRGRPGHDWDGWRDTEPSAARWLPWTGGSVGIALFDHVVLSYEREWMRLPMRREVYAYPAGWQPGQPTPPAPTGPPLRVEESTRWAPLSLLRLTLRY